MHQNLNYELALVLVWCSRLVSRTNSGTVNSWKNATLALTGFSNSGDCIDTDPVFFFCLEAFLRRCKLLVMNWLSEILTISWFHNIFGRIGILNFTGLTKNKLRCPAFWILSNFWTVCKKNCFIITGKIWYLAVFTRCTSNSLARSNAANSKILKDICALHKSIISSPNWDGSDLWWMMKQKLK